VHKYRRADNACIVDSSSSSFRQDRLLFVLFAVLVLTEVVIQYKDILSKRFTIYNSTIITTCSHSALFSGMSLYDKNS
jgi:hypothetical protein